MNFPQILGQIQGAADGALSIIGAVTGQAESHAPTAEHVLVHVPDQAALQQLANAVTALAPGADKRPALADLYPDLDPKSLDIGLELANQLSVALKNDGRVDFAEAAGLLRIAMRGVL